MPRQYFKCPCCGQIDLISYAAADVDQPDWPPRCTVDARDCDQPPMERAPQPGDYGWDMKTDGDGGKGFQKFTVHRTVPTRDGIQHVEEVVDSVHKLRQIEKDSEQRYRNGEGEPIRFRVYNQDHSNMDRNSFGDAGTIGDRAYDSGKAPQKKTNVGVRRHGEKKPNVPVARGGGVSALKG